MTPRRPRTKAVKPATPEPSPPALVEVVPLGRVDPVALEVAAANLQAILGLGADILEAWPEPDYALLRERGQYNAGPILKALAGGRNGPPIRMGLTRLDLCLPILTFVYGEAQMGGQAAVVSYHRLGEERPGEIILPALLYERLAKVVVHEAAHVLGLSHCRAPACLMRFSQSLEQLDGLDLLFCDQCQYELGRRRQILRRGFPAGT